MSEKVWNITKYEIRQYAQATENLEPACMEETYAKECGFRSIIAPTSFCAQYQMYQDPLAKVPTGGVHTKQKMIFFKPIQAGDRITAKIEVTESRDAKDRRLIIYTTEFVNQDGDTVCMGEMTNMIPTPKA